MKRLLTGLYFAMLLLVGIGTASAQDEFKGFYIGGTTGLVISRSDTQTTTVFDPAGYFANSSV
ncbi:MAG TPA: hypothetical protein VL382_02025, partial [Terriglobales bacterium]|nr:hypothetical protein [Terriglobales bacterium]